VVSATFSGIFGQTSIYAGSNAHHQLLLDNILVADTMTFVPSPYTNIVPFNLTLTSPALLAAFQDGSTALDYIQTSEFVVRLSSTTLTLETVPEPASLLLVSCAVGIMANALTRRCRRRAPAA
jgi:hypothetical protein